MRRPEFLFRAPVQGEEQDQGEPQELIFPLSTLSVPAIDHEDAISMMEAAAAPNLDSELGC